MSKQKEHGHTGTPLSRATRRRRGTRHGEAETDKVTQSARLKPEQMKVIEAACELVGWSVAQLLERAAVEKATAIVNVRGEKSAGCEALADDFVAGCLARGRLRVIDSGRVLMDPDPKDSDWEKRSDPDGGFMWFTDVCDEMTAVALTKDLTSCRVLSDYWPGKEIRVTCVAVSENDLRHVVDQMERMGAEVWPLLQRSLEKWNTRGRNLDLLDPRSLLDQPRPAIQTPNMEDENNDRS